MGPVFATIMAVTGALMAHLILMLAGGEKKGFQVTLRVFCFCTGSGFLLELADPLGGPLALIWDLRLLAWWVCVWRTISTLGRSVAAMVLFAAQGVWWIYRAGVPGVSTIDE